MSVDEVIAHAIAGTERSTRVTLPAEFQGLPDAAHGGSVLAVFDAIARGAGAREIDVTYRRRVPLETTFDLETRPEGSGLCLELRGGGLTFVQGLVTPVANAVGAADHGAEAREQLRRGESAPDPGRPRSARPGTGQPLPVSWRCFACGIENAMGLHAALEFDDRAVWTEYRPRAAFRTGSGRVSTAALTTLLDEAAFWLGVLRTNEAGMTVRSLLSGPLPADPACYCALTRK